MAPSTTVRKLCIPPPPLHSGTAQGTLSKAAEKIETYRAEMSRNPMPSPRTPGGQKGWSKAGGQICTNAQKSYVRQKHVRSRQQVDVGSGILAIYCRFPDALVCPGRDPQSRSGQMTLDRSENLQELQIRHRPLWHATATSPCLQLVDFHIHVLDPCGRHGAWPVWTVLSRAEACLLLRLCLAFGRDAAVVAQEEGCSPPARNGMSGSQALASLRSVPVHTNRATKQGCSKAAGQASPTREPTGKARQEKNRTHQGR